VIPQLASKIEPQLTDDKDVVQFVAAAAIIHLSEVHAKPPRHK